MSLAKFRKIITGGKKPPPTPPKHDDKDSKDKE